MSASGGTCEVVQLGELDDAFSRRAPVERPEWAGDALGAERDRGHDVEHRHELEMLVDHPDPRLDRLGRVVEGPRRPVDQDLAGVWAIEPRQDVHQRRLAGAVLPKEPEHLTTIGRDRDPIVGEDTWELLRDVLQFEAHLAPALARVCRAARPRLIESGRPSGSTDGQAVDYFR